MRDEGGILHSLPPYQNPECNTKVLKSSARADQSIFGDPRSQCGQEAGYATERVVGIEINTLAAEPDAEMMNLGDFYIPWPVDDPDIEEAEQDATLDLAEEISKDEVAAAPSDTGDPTAIVESKIPEDIRRKYEIYSYRNAATILSETRKAEFGDLLKALRDFKITKKMIRTAGGNESEIPKLLSATLRPLGWHETVVQGDLLVKLTWREPVGSVKSGKKKRQLDIRSEKPRGDAEEILGWAQNRLCEEPRRLRSGVEQ